jgi:hypothetical protein
MEILQQNKDVRPSKRGAPLQTMETGTAIGGDDVSCASPLSRHV